MRIRLLRPLDNFVNSHINKNTKKLVYPEYILEGPNQNVEVLGIASEELSRSLFEDSGVLKDAKELAEAEGKEFFDLLIPTYLLDHTNMFYYLIVQGGYPRGLSNEDREKYYNVAKYLLLGAVDYAIQNRQNNDYPNSYHFNWIRNMNENDRFHQYYDQSYQPNINENTQRRINESYNNYHNSEVYFEDWKNMYANELRLGGKRKTRKLKRRVRQSKRTARAKRR